MLMVVATHAGLYGEYGFAYEDSRVLARLSSLGQGIAGVSVFFVLSGFLITTLLLRERRRHGRLDLLAFYARRFLRIMPGYLVFLFTLFLLARVGLLPLSREALLCAAAYLTNFVHRIHYYGELGHTWSLAVEEHYYLVWPLLLTRLRGRVLVGFLFAMIAISTAGYLGFAFRSPLRRDYFTEYWTIPAALGIFVGSLLASVREGEVPRPAFFDRLGARALIPGLLLYAAPLWLPPALLPAVLLPMDLGVALILWGLLSRPDAPWVRLLEQRPLRYLGTISYSLYVWQGLFLRTGPGGQLWVQHQPQALILTLLTAALSYHLIERPFLGLKARFAR